VLGTISCDRRPRLPFQSVVIIAIAVLSILCMLLRPRGIPEAYWACGGALLLVLTRLLPLRQAGHAVRQGLDVYLFLTGMMILAEVAREEGVFEWVADVAAHHANGSTSRLFLLIYLAGTVVTILLSNDATAVVLTPAVLAVVRRAKVEPKPYVLACALIANAASFVLPISNPANLVVFARNMPRLAEWLRAFLLPSVAAIAITFLVLRFLSREELRSTIQFLRDPVKLSSNGRLAVLGLAIACVALLAASALGFDLGAPTCIAAIIALLLVAFRDRSIPARAMRGVSWSVLPLVAGLFVIVQALQNAGLARLGSQALQSVTRMPTLLGNLAAAFGVGLVSNAMNNLPVGLIGGGALQASGQSGGIAHAVLIGVDLGPNLSVTGSLATILWLIALRREKVEITAWQFLKIGMIAMPLALFGSILLLGR
jgi:arsenical pump membrane protein